MSKTWPVTNDTDGAAALAQAAPGDVIDFRDGNFSIAPIPARGGLAGQPIRIYGNDDHRDRVRVKGGDLSLDFVEVSGFTVDKGPTLAIVSNRTAPVRYTAIRNSDLVQGSNATHSEYCVHDHCQIGSRALQKGYFAVEKNAFGPSKYHQVISCSADLYAAVGGNGTKCMTLSGVSNLAMIDPVFTFNKMKPNGCIQGVNQDGSGCFAYDLDNSSILNPNFRFVDTTGCGIIRVSIEFRNGCTGNTIAGGWIDQDDCYALYFSASGDNTFNGNNRWLNLKVRSRGRAAESIIAQAGLYGCELSRVRFECAPGAAAPFALSTSVDAATQLNNVEVCADTRGLNFTPAGTARLNGMRYLPAVP